MVLIAVDRGVRTIDEDRICRGLTAEKEENDENATARVGVVVPVRVAKRGEQLVWRVVVVDALGAAAGRGEDHGKGAGILLFVELLWISDLNCLCPCPAKAKRQIDSFGRTVPCEPSIAHLSP